MYKDIPGYEGRYKVNESGELISLQRVVTHINGKKIPIKEKVVTHKLPRGASYPHAFLYKNNKGKLFRIHRLVALAWILNPDNKPNVNHKDGNKLNCHKDNLEWCSQSENMYHCKNTLKKNLNISLSNIIKLYEENKECSLETFIQKLSKNCK